MSFWRDSYRVARRELTRIWSDSRLRSVVIIAPFAYASLFCVIYSRQTPEDLPIAVVQQDQSQGARRLVRMLEASPKLAVAHRLASLEEAKELMLRGKADGVIVIPRDMTRRLKRGEDAFIPAYVNAGSMVSANTVGKAFNEVVQTFSAGVELRTLMKKGERLHQARRHFMPAKLDLRPLFNPSFNYANFMVPGILIAVLQQVILLGLALSWAGEKERGTLVDLFKVTRSVPALMLGKALPYLLINAVVAEIFLRVVFPLNDIPVEGDWHLVIPFTFLFVLTIVSWGMWVSGLCRTRLFATQILMFVAMPSFVLSGFTYPREAMPWLAQALGSLLPMTYFINSFRNVYLAGVPWQYVLPDALALLAFTTLNIGLTYVVIRRLVRRTMSTMAGPAAAAPNDVQPLPQTSAPQA